MNKKKFERERDRECYNLSSGQTAFIDRKQPGVMQGAIVLLSGVCLAECFEQHNLLSYILPIVSQNI